MFRGSTILAIDRADALDCEIDGSRVRFLACAHHTSTRPTHSLGHRQWSRRLYMPPDRKPENRTCRGDLFVSRPDASTRVAIGHARNDLFAALATALLQAIVVRIVNPVCDRVGRDAQIGAFSRAMLLVKAMTPPWRRIDPAPPFEPSRAVFRGDVIAAQTRRFARLASAALVPANTAITEIDLKELSPNLPLS